VSTARWTSKTHRVTSETQQRHCARSSVTNVFSLEENSPQETSLSNLLEIHEINFEENWRYRTLSKLETLFHVTNVTTVLNSSIVSDRVSRWWSCHWCFLLCASSRVKVVPLGGGITVCAILMTSYMTYRCQEQQIQGCLWYRTQGVYTCHRRYVRSDPTPWSYCWWICRRCCGDLLDIWGA